VGISYLIFIDKNTRPIDSKTQNDHINMIKHRKSLWPSSLYAEVAKYTERVVRNRTAANAISIQEFENHDTYSPQTSNEIY
jgi:hypothetical protein